MVVPSKGVLLNWKLRPEVSFLEAELFAIHEVLEWAQNNLESNEKFVIFTDSLSSLYLIADRKPHLHVHLIFQIQEKLMALASMHDLNLQFIPGHQGIAGNADHAALLAHTLWYRTITPRSKEETVRNIWLCFY
jgi:ribonuclease HI